MSHHTDKKPIIKGNLIKGLKYKHFKPEQDKRSKEIDKYLTHPVWGLLSFIFIIWFIFYATFTLGAYPQQGIEWIMDQGAAYIRDNMAAGWFNDFLSQGVIMGVGSVLAFLPNILILFFFLSFLQETEYLPRAATIMDKYMHKIGLHGSSFIPLLMGFGDGNYRITADLTTMTVRFEAM
jgi:ferrous iron transport protein B